MVNNDKRYYKRVISLSEKLSDRFVQDRMYIEHEEGALSKWEGLQQA